ncbi:hypothetical protein A9P44_16315 [Paenibacillus polymyxa]|nr:hypothetical protein A9P44_16315 [Paenibacillus polymyxa]
MSWETLLVALVIAVLVQYDDLFDFELQDTFLTPSKNRIFNNVSYSFGLIWAIVPVNFYVIPQNTSVFIASY